MVVNEVNGTCLVETYHAGDRLLGRRVFRLVCVNGKLASLKPKPFESMSTVPKYCFTAVCTAKSVQLCTLNSYLGV